uniref:50S ribosomal protein L11ic n=1 Tax=Rhizophora mucronata TaxID=61149 RepID=A0A2P2K4U1_RHIMU
MPCCSSMHSDTRALPVRNNVCYQSPECKHFKPQLEHFWSMFNMFKPTQALPKPVSNEYIQY